MTTLEEASILAPPERSAVKAEGPFWVEARNVLFLTFVGSQGRQYAQLSELMAAAAFWYERSVNGDDFVTIDWDIVDSDAAVEAIRTLRLPGWHTPVPPRNMKPDNGVQVAGVFEFWWRNFGHALHLYYHDRPLPTREQLEEQFALCGVRPRWTSSSSREELVTMDDAFSVFRAHQGRIRELGFRELIKLCLPEKIEAEIHWQAREREGQHRDPFVSNWLTTATRALDLPPSRRRTYDWIYVAMADVMDWALEQPQEAIEADPVLRRIRTLYRELVEGYNSNHPHAPVEFLHKPASRPG